MKALVTGATGLLGNNLVRGDEVAWYRAHDAAREPAA